MRTSNRRLARRVSHWEGVSQISQIHADFLEEQTDSKLPTFAVLATIFEPGARSTWLKRTAGHLSSEKR